jgi:hypothetical protein
MSMKYRLMTDNYVSISHLKNRVSNQDEARNISHPYLLEIVNQQKRQIEKLKDDYSMLYKLVLDHTKSI